MNRLKPELSVFAFILSPTPRDSWEPVFEFVRAADRAGVDRAVMTGEHVVFGENLEAYSDPSNGGRTGGKQLTDPDGYYLDPFIAAATMFATTRTIRLATNVILAPLRRPIVLAKTTTSLDVLSGGRLDLGVGVGWQKEEYIAAGVPFEKRGRLLDHALEVCELLWTERRASYSSPELEFQNIHMMPKPVTPGGVPVWISGNLKPPVVRRLARFGKGWLPWSEAGQDNAVLVEEIKLMRELVSKEGRDPSDIQVSGMMPVVYDNAGKPLIGPTMEAVPALVDAGVTEFRIRFPWSEAPAAAEAAMREWVAAFREATT